VHGLAGEGILLRVTAALAHYVPPEPPPQEDHRVILHGMSWHAYEAILAWRGESSGVRITYLEGELELMSPAWRHETDKKQLARLLEAWAEETDTELQGGGSWTVKDRSVDRGAEPDECYLVGRVEPDHAPDIAIEVIWTSGGIDKLEVWRKLGAREVWFWKGGALSFYVLRGARYARKERSELLPKLDPALITRCMGAASQTEAVKQLRREMRAASRQTRRRST
jgi:Uma2 family endonuclease